MKILSHQTQNKDNKIGNGNRTVEFETEQLQGVFPNAKQDDFFTLQNGNKAIQLVFDINNNYYINRFEILIEFLYDYPNTPPTVKVIKPDITGAPHRIYNNTMCYNNPSLDWKTSFTSYDVAIMIQSWIYAYCKWKERGFWDWYQDEEYIPQPTRKVLIPSKTRKELQTTNTNENGNRKRQDKEYYKTPLYYCYNNEYTSNKDTKEEIPNIYPGSGNNNTNDYSNIGYGRTNIDDYSDNSYGRIYIDNNRVNNESTSIAGRIIFATLFSVMFIAYNHLTTMVVAPFFALLFISKKSRTILFIILSLLIVVSNPWSFVAVPIFGLMYTMKKRYQIPILCVLILFWMFVAFYGYNIVDLQMFKYH